MAGLNKIQTLMRFFDVPPLKLDELKPIGAETRFRLAREARDALIREGRNKPEDFDAESFSRA